MGRCLIDAEKPSQHRAAVPAAAIVDAISAVLPARGAAAHSLRGWLAGHGSDLGAGLIAEVSTQGLEKALTGILDRAETKPR